MLIISLDEAGAYKKVMEFGDSNGRYLPIWVWNHNILKPNYDFSVHIAHLKWSNSELRLDLVARETFEEHKGNIAGYPGLVCEDASVLR